MKTRILFGFLTLFVLLIHEAGAQGTAFIYQGRLIDNGAPAQGSYDLRFLLFDGPAAGAVIAGPITNTSVAVADGLLAVTLDFGGGVFDGPPRWLQIGVRTNGSNTFIAVSPRQALMPSPYAIHAATVRLTNGAVDTAQLAAGAVTRAKIASNAVDTLQLADFAVTTPKLALGAADTAQIANGAVTAIKLASNAVTTAKIADFAVDTMQLAAAAVTTGKLTNGAVTSAKVADGTLIPADLDVERFNTTFWRTDGNSNTTPGVHFIGTTDDEALELHVNGVRALRLVPNGTSPNIIGGAPGNKVTGGAVGATIAGGGGSSLFYHYTNVISGDFGTIGGGGDNLSSGNFATVGGGIYNASKGGEATIGGGFQNTNTGSYATIGGGSENISSGSGATVGGGARNKASGEDATVCGGAGNIASGDYSTVCGVDNTAAGVASFAGGFLANATHRSSFVWAGGNTSEFPSETTNRFHVYAQQGFQVEFGGQQESGRGNFWVTIGSANTPTKPINTFIGAYLSIGGAWVNSSDRNKKENFEPVDTRAVLEKVAALPLTTWNYKSESVSTKHLGPMAQDFRAAFGLGNDEKSIGTVDADGVALAAIQGLNQKLETQRAENAELKRDLAELRELVQHLAQQR